MSILLKHINTQVNTEHHYKLFPYGKYTEATGFVYTAIGAAVYEQADLFVIKENCFRWMKSHKPIGTFLGSGAAIPTPTYPEVFKIIRLYDEIVAKHTVIDAELDNTLYVSFLSD